MVCVVSLTCFFFCLSLSLNIKISLSGGILNGFPPGDISSVKRSNHICYCLADEPYHKTNNASAHPIDHQDNMSVCFIPPYFPLLYSKTGVYRGIN